MQTNSVLRISLAAMVAISIFLIASGLQLRYYVRTGPGPGFFPVWIGILLGLGSLYMLAESFLQRQPRESFFETREAAIRVAIVVLALACVLLALKYLGFRITILGFALSVPLLLGRQSWITTLVVALIASFGVAYAFEKWLKVWLPSPQIEFLQNLGF